MPDCATERFGLRGVVVLDAKEEDRIEIDFDIGAARLYLLNEDLIARTITDRLIFLAGFTRALHNRPTLVVSSLGGPTVQARDLIKRAKRISGIVELFERSPAMADRRPRQG